jgi:phospholipid/cholesterol/gamma-HCH transport system permease protein
MANLEAIVAALPPAGYTIAALDGSELTQLDTAGAMTLITAARIDPPGDPSRFRNFNVRQTKVLQLVLERFRPARYPEPEVGLPLVQEIGRSTIEVSQRFTGLLAFFGETAAAFGRTLKTPHLLRPRELFVQLERTCVYAIPIVALVTFLIGVVVAYLSAMQLQKYGANIFIVDGIGLTMARELSPVLVAIIVAGRSGSAFTAQIGAMKINEEIDALQALGLSPIHVLVLPRLIALIIAMPLLTFVGDVIGIAGGALIANEMLGITPITFYERLQTVLPLKAYLVGLGKAPVFAAVIALIGCRMGFRVENTATSVGINTTSTVVQSIVSVILLDAAFAVIFQKLGI